MKVGIDTNVLFYSLNKDSPFHEEARENLAMLVEEQSAVLTQQNLVELVAILTRRGVTSEITRNYLYIFAEAMPVLKPTAKTVDLFLKQIEKKPVKGAKVFDLYLAATLISNGVNLLYTYNEKDFAGIEGLHLWKLKDTKDKGETD